MPVGSFKIENEIHADDYLDSVLGPVEMQVLLSLPAKAEDGLLDCKRSAESLWIVCAES